MKISWVAVFEPTSGLSRLCTWSGPTEAVVVTGVPLKTWQNCPLTFEAPDTAVVHEVPAGKKAIDYAREIGGVAVTRFKAST